MYGSEMSASRAAIRVVSSQTAGRPSGVSTPRPPSTPPAGVLRRAGPCPAAPGRPQGDERRVGEERRAGRFQALAQRRRDRVPRAIADLEEALPARAAAAPEP